MLPCHSCLSSAMCHPLSSFNKNSKFLFKVILFTNLVHGVSAELVCRLHLKGHCTNMWAGDEDRGWNSKSSKLKHLSPLCHRPFCTLNLLVPVFNSLQLLPKHSYLLYPLLKIKSVPRNSVICIPFWMPKIYGETHTVKFSFKHKESAFIVSWYVVCQPLDVSAAPLRKGSTKESFPCFLPCRWEGNESWDYWLLSLKYPRNIHIYWKKTPATEIESFINCTYLKQLLYFKPLILNSRWERRLRTGVTAICQSLWAWWVGLWAV